MSARRKPDDVARKLCPLPLTLEDAADARDLAPALDKMSRDALHRLGKWLYGDGARVDDGTLREAARRIDLAEGCPG